MKIRLALNSDFVSRKIRGAAYGILLLLTFFVPQFAKTEDQLNAARQAQAAKKPVIALEQKQAGTSLGKSEGTYAAISPIPDAEAPGTAEPAPAQIALMTQTVALAEIAPVPETVRLSEPPIVAANQAIRSVPVEIASAASNSIAPAAPLTETVPLPETARLSSPFTVVASQAVEPVRAEPVRVASLATTAIPAAAQSAPAAGAQFSEKHLTMDLVNTPLVDFFRMMAVEGGINIMLDPAIQGNVTFMVTKMPWDQLFEAVLLNHGLDKKVEGSMIRVALKKTLQEEAKQEEALKTAHLLASELVTRIKRLNYAKASELKTLLDGRKTARGTVAVDERTNSLVLMDINDSVEEMEKLIAGLDISQPQVQIETRIVAATRNFARDIGVQFGFVQGNNQRVTVGGANANYLQPDARRPMSDTGNSSNSPGISTGGNDTGGNLNVNLPSRTPFGGIGIAVGNIVDTLLLDAAITAGESRGWAKMISQPSVIVQNNNLGVITNGIRFPVPVNSDNTITIQYYDAALTLTVTPQITYDGNIFLDMKATNNKADFGYTATGGIPTIRTSEASSRVLVTDGGTTLFAGINVDDDSSNEEKIPGLGSLPLIGNLFRRTGSQRDSQEILFFVTPTIVR